MRMTHEQWIEQKRREAIVTAKKIRPDQLGEIVGRYSSDMFNVLVKLLVRALTGCACALPATARFEA